MLALRAGAALRRRGHLRVGRFYNCLLGREAGRLAARGRAGHGRRAIKAGPLRRARRPAERVALVLGQDPEVERLRAAGGAAAGAVPGRHSVKGRRRGGAAAGRDAGAGPGPRCCFSARSTSRRPVTSGRRYSGRASPTSAPTSRRERASGSRLVNRGVVARLWRPESSSRRRAGRAARPRFRPCRASRTASFLERARRPRPRGARREGAAAGPRRRRARVLRADLAKRSTHPQLPPACLLVPEGVERVPGSARRRRPRVVTRQRDDACPGGCCN